MDILGRGIFANDHFAFLYAMLRMNRHQHTIALDVDDESPQFEITRPLRHPLSMNV